MYVYLSQPQKFILTVFVHVYFTFSPEGKSKYKAIKVKQNNTDAHLFNSLPTPIASNAN